MYSWKRRSTLSEFDSTQHLTHIGKNKPLHTPTHLCQINCCSLMSSHSSFTSDGIILTKPHCTDGSLRVLCLQPGICFRHRGLLYVTASVDQGCIASPTHPPHTGDKRSKGYTTITGTTIWLSMCLLASRVSSAFRTCFRLYMTSSSSVATLTH